MTRYIDADALLPMMKYATTDSEIGVFPIKIGFNAIAKVIEDAPTVDAVPLKHGRWVWNDYGGFGNYHCSECGKICICNGDYDYCPNCGARMDKE